MEDCIMATVTLQPVAMRAVTKECIYAPSKLHRPKTISYDEFLERYAGHGHSMQVSFAEDGKSNPQTVTAYGRGLDCWYIII